MMTCAIAPFRKLISIYSRCPDQSCSDAYARLLFWGACLGGVRPALGGILKFIHPYVQKKKGTFSRVINTFRDSPHSVNQRRLADAQGRSPSRRSQLPSAQARLRPRRRFAPNPSHNTLHRRFCRQPFCLRQHSAGKFRNTRCRTAQNPMIEIIPLRFRQNRPDPHGIPLVHGA